ncbi:MAG TPA: hypothetical protein VHC21_03125 [Candidatus Saccharimonadales bacterium]|nr:hypothetical protein [Candidatus Saccharimonadales bacterium]
MADNSEKSGKGDGAFTGYMNVAGYSADGGFFSLVDRVSWISSQFMAKTPLLEGGSDDPSDPTTYVKSSTRYQMAAKYGSELTIAALINAGVLSKDTEIDWSELQAVLSDIEENSSNGMEKE